MLILTRKPSETIRIGDDIILTVLGVSGQQTRLGIKAPAGVAVHRQEIYERIQAEAAATGQGEQTTDTPVAADSMHIDERVRMAANAKRYEWLRDRGRVTDLDTDLCVARDDTVYFGHDLDKIIDDAMRLAQLEELHPCAG